LSKISLAVEVAGLELRSPTMNASGVLGMSAHLLRRIYEAGAGAVVTKSLGPEPRAGHPNPTMVAVEGGFLNALGLPNPGVDSFVDEIKELKGEGIPVVASFFGSSVRDFERSARVLSEAGVDALEINLSCPNVEEEMGMLASDAANVERVTTAIRGATNKPVFVKLSPNVTDIVEIARAAEKGGADAITAGNTLKGMAVDIDFRRPILANITGGLSGPALKPVALRCVWEIAEFVHIPIIGCGGVSTWRDAIEFVLCGASAVEVGTAIRTHGFEVFRDINNGLISYMEKNRFKSIEEVVGLAHRR
jgi:dihydroorotate dehydrogenase (NAD+) catalytic subunit